eukprot:12626835-Alexandrium_andersonii.AAC.1
MSASLVGSEMCIRDRPLPHVTYAAAARGGIAHDERLSPRAQRHLQGSVAVSYTHLTLPTICSV